MLSSQLIPAPCRPVISVTIESCLLLAMTMTNAVEYHTCLRIKYQNVDKMGYSIITRYSMWCVMPSLIITQTECFSCVCYVFFYKLWTYLVMVCQTINLYAFLSKHCTVWLYRSSFVVVHCRRPCLSRGRGSSVEQSARIRHSVIVTAHVQATPEDYTVREKLLNTGCFRRLEHLPSHVILFMFNFVRCPCSRSDIMPP